MKKYYLKERDALEQKNAGSKARNDVESIVESIGYEAVDVVLPYRESRNLADSFKTHVKIAAFFKKQLSGLQAGDELLVQFPPRSHSVFLPLLFRSLRKSGVHVTFLIHDLERMRFSKLADMPFKKRLRILIEETLLMRQANILICHNEKMKAFLADQGFASGSIVNLKIWDYLTDCPMRSMEEKNSYNKVIIAGNLSPEKCAYITELDKVPEVEFQLYGVGYEDLGQENVTYHGSFLPDELVGALVGDFGLVWDGTSIDTCTGIFGNYLRLNDPHKLSLYLTAGFPVIVWDEAAVADFVREHNVGLTVASLSDIPGKLAAMSCDEYFTMARNAADLSGLLRSGHFLKAALGAE